jgi:hypothetical protein
MVNWQEVGCLHSNQLVLLFATVFDQQRRAVTTAVKFPHIGEREKNLSATSSNLCLPDKSCDAVIGCEGLFHCLQPRLSGGADYGDFHVYKDLSGTFQYGNRYSLPFPGLNIVCIDTTGTLLVQA